MKGFLERIEAADFSKLLKRLIIIASTVFIACCVLTVFMFRTQLTELYALEKMEDNTALKGEGQMSMAEHGSYWHDDDCEIDIFGAGLVTYPSPEAIITAVTSVVICSLCVLAYWLLVAAWLYKVSVKAGMNPALWSTLGLFFNLPAVLAFLIVRRGLVHCQNCGAWQKEGKFCASCGANLGKVCPKCGRMSKTSDKFCPNCGTKLTDKGTKEVQS